jgi:TonB family protein
MSDLGGLSQCMMDSDAGAIGRARQLRRRALFASVFLEVGAVATMLLWPLITPGVLPARIEVTPLPPFHGARNPVVTHPQQSDHSGPRRPNIPQIALRQPSRIPRHISQTEDAAPPNPDEISGPPEPMGLDIGIPGDEPGVIRIARPDTPKHAKEPLMVSSVLMNAQLIHRVEPEYPLPARFARLSGTVQLRATIGTDGAVHGLVTVSGNPMFVQAARTAVMQWRYQPTLLSGKAVEVETIITVDFLID